MYRVGRKVGLFLKFLIPVYDNTEIGIPLHQNVQFCFSRVALILSVSTFTQV